MIKSNFKKKEVKIEGKKSEILTEFAMIVHGLTDENNFSKDEIEMAMNIGLHDEKELPKVLVDHLIKKLDDLLENINDEED